MSLTGSRLARWTGCRSLSTRRQCFGSGPDDSCYTAHCPSAKRRSCLSLGRCFGFKTAKIWGRTFPGDTAGSAAHCRVARCSAAAAAEWEWEEQAAKAGFVKAADCAAAAAADRSKAVTVAFGRVCRLVTLDNAAAATATAAKKKIEVAAGATAVASRCLIWCRVAATEYRHHGMDKITVGHLKGRNLIGTGGRACHRALHFVRTVVLVHRLHRAATADWFRRHF